MFGKSKHSRCVAWPKLGIDQQKAAFKILKILSNAKQKAPLRF